MVDPPNEAELQLRQWLGTLRRRWLVLLAVLVVAVGTALVYLGVRAPVYSASAQVTVGVPTDSSSPQVGLDLAGLAELAKSVEVTRQVTQQLGAHLEPVVTPLGTDVLSIEVRSASPSLAADAANTYADVLVKVRNDDVQAQLAQAAEQLQERITDVDTQVAALPGTESTNGPVRTQLEAQRSAYSDALSKVRVQSALALLNGERVLSRASAPTAPSQLASAEVVVLALVLGLVLGIGAITLAEYADGRVRQNSPDPLGAGLPIVGTVPRFRPRAGRRIRDLGSWVLHLRTWRRRDVAVLPEPSSRISESYRSLRTTLLAPVAGAPPRTVLVTSAAGEDSAAEVAVNLAIALTRSKRPVVLVDVDYRHRDRLSRLLPTSTSDDEPGLAAALDDGADLEDVTSKVDGIDGLSVVPAGLLDPAVAADLLASSKAQPVLAGLSTKDELVLLVAPSVLHASETAHLALCVDATLLVTRAGVTRRKDVARAVERLADVGASRVGLVLVTR
jgi:polysaccharide biosynthesis transport protein